MNTVLVTGASRGIGRATALLAATRGWPVAINYRNDARAADQDVLALSGPPYPIRSAETVFELSYTAQIAPWWSIQPDLQYIVRPSGGVPDPNDPSRTVGNAFVTGVRTTITF